MTRKKIDKKVPRLEPQFHDVLICKKNDCRPFLEVLVEEPENVSRQNLGILVGIFQIDDHSEDSSYVVNYLISIIKKEYFSRANRGPVENFEAALHKANLALAKLATHENIGWIGKINAICAVIEKNNLLLSQTGSASAFLLRGATMTEITEMPDENVDSNPLKTFQDVISGRIEKNDKLLFTTKEIFEIFSLEEIKKSALKFSRENFIQFLNTALVNELDQAVVLVADIVEEVAEIVATPRAKKAQDLNVFSQTAFQKELSPKMLEKERAKEEATMKERREMIQELKEDAKDFVDKKTGHIYIKEPRDFQPEDSEQKTTIDFSVVKEKFSDLASLSAEFLSNAKNKTKDLLLSLWQKSRAKISQIHSKEKPATALEIKNKTALFLKKTTTGVFWLKDEITDGIILILRKPTQFAIKSTAFLKDKWQKYKNEKPVPPANTANTGKRYPWENTPVANSTPEIETRKTTRLRQLIEPKKILPDFSRLKQITGKFDQKQKFFALLILVVLLVFPYWIAKWERKIEQKPQTVQEPPKIILPLENDLNVSRVEKPDEVYAGNILRIINLNNKFFAQTDTEIIDLENKKSFPLSSDFQSPELFFGMDDLNLIFLVKNSKVISLSPTTGKFQDNQLAFPTTGKIVSAGAYLTYIYLLDAKGSQIYRAPRADGGFGEKTAWLKDTLDLSAAKDLAINENIFILDGQNILKLFRGKKIDFSVENTATPIIPDKIYAQNSSTNLYILDKTNARIIKLDSDGKILAQYYNTNIANATNFSVSEENNLIYISDTKGVRSFGMSQ